ncbi:MAG: FmdB family zinc ribbon protein [Actinomycetota bacterium]|nr:FmdB family transcriptional regulator [Actinomycetota bacterium]
MPTYEYRCQDCGNQVEVVQSFTDEPLTVCDVCGGRLRRVFHPVGIVLKGSGFYSTDNRAGKRPSAAKPKDEGTTKSDSKPSESSSESSSKSSESSSKTKDGGGSKPKAS